MDKEKIAIRVTLEQDIWLDKETWDSFGQRLPVDMDDLEMLQSESLSCEMELVKADFLVGLN